MNKSLYPGFVQHTNPAKRDRRQQLREIGRRQLLKHEKAYRRTVAHLEGLRELARRGHEVQMAIERELITQRATPRDWINGVTNGR